MINMSNKKLIFKQLFCSNNQLNKIINIERLIEC